MTDEELVAVITTANAQHFRALRGAAEVEEVPSDEVLQAVSFLRQRADAGDNVARACLVLFRHLNRRLE